MDLAAAIRIVRNLGQLLCTLGQLVLALISYFVLCCRSGQSLAAENLVLRKQLAWYQERKVRPGPIDPATRITLAVLSRLFDWRSALVVVQPATLIRWHRMGFRLLWRWKSKPGRPKIPTELQQLIRRMALENHAWAKNGLPMSCC